MIYQNVAELFENYDSFFIDVYGVIYNGQDIFDGVLDLMKRIKESGKKIVIVSNATQIAEDCKQKYSKKGLLEKIHYDEFISSGEAFCKCFKEHIKEAKSFFSAFNRNENLFKSLNLEETKSIEAADFVYIGSLNNFDKSYTIDNLKSKSGKPIKIEDIVNTDYHDIAGFEQISNLLDDCLKLKKTLVVLDTDIFVIEAVSSNGIISKRPVLCQGAVGEFYENAGGNVLYFGKPYQHIYNFAKKFLNGFSKTAMIGDTIWTDIIGGNTAGLNTILVLTGVSGQFLNNIKGNDTEQKIKILTEEIALKMTHKKLQNLNSSPTYIAKTFA